MTFTELLALTQSAGMQIGLCSDSRQVRSGDIFVAVRGSNVDGHDFIDQAVGRGAGYVVCERPYHCDSAEIVIVSDGAAALGRLAQTRFGDPAAHLTNLAVTGTNGKTTVGYLTRSVITSVGAGCGLVGTIVYDTGTKAAEQASLTTPSAIDIARLGCEMRQGGAEYMVIEASSHALAQGRLSGIDFSAAAFTNLTGDHLDYHETREGYLAAKSLLFENLPVHATAVLNKQSDACQEIARRTKCRILWYAIDEAADIVGHIESMDMDQTVFGLEFNDCRDVVRTPLVGRHNVSNHLAAAGLCFAAGFGLSTVASGLSGLDHVPGRLESVECGQPFKVLVDYAHTDDALKNVLQTVKPLCRGRLIVAFGCGGDRDRTKRARMARVAEEYGDIVVVTSDNPRSERPEDIIAEVLTGFSNRDSERIAVEPDRGKAIELALRAAAADDIVLIAGKGHEDYQIIGTEKQWFDDRAVAREVLSRIG